MVEDAAFVWNSKTARPARPVPPRPSTGSVGPPTQPDRWVTLKAAEQATGVAAATIRNWARKGRIPSRIEESDGARRRFVDVGAAVERARALGHLDPPRPAEPSPGPARPEAAVPNDHVLVPLEAWEKVLLQLGNLHTAGQELADARERAAKAETEAAFLRERLAELRQAEARSAPDTPSADVRSRESPAQDSGFAQRAARRYQNLTRRIRGFRG